MAHMRRALCKRAAVILSARHGSRGRGRDWQGRPAARPSAPRGELGRRVGGVAAKSNSRLLVARDPLRLPRTSSQGASTSCTPEILMIIESKWKERRVTSRVECGAAAWCYTHLRRASSLRTTTCSSFTKSAQLLQYNRISNTIAFMMLTEPECVLIIYVGPASI